jgi:hypothetical protein
VTFTNTKGVLHSNDNSHCGKYVFVLDPVYPFLKVMGTDPFNLDLYTDDLLAAGIYQISLTVSLPDFPDIAPLTKTFEVKLICMIMSYTQTKELPTYSNFQIQTAP